MVLKKSEYQNQFKSSTITKNQSVYLENLNFRHVRRDREFIHTPIGWHNLNDEEVVSSEEETNDNNNCNVNSKGKDNEPQYQSLAEILDQSKAKSIAFRQQKKEDCHSKDLPDMFNIGRISLEEEDDSNLKKNSLSEVCDDVDHNEKLKDGSCEKTSFEKSSATCIKEKENGKKLKSQSNMRRKGNSRNKNTEHTNLRASSGSGIKEPADSHNAHEQAGQSIPSLHIGTRLRRPDRQRRIPSAKCRPISQERPPFVAYGAGDIEDTFTSHRTHNVRSTVDVYGAALKAKIRREEERKRQLARQNKLAQSTNDLLERLASATPRDMIDWRSEYQKQFHGYEPREYERSCSSRAVIRHAVPIRAVHRGGSLIVHVD